MGDDQQENREAGGKGYTILAGAEEPWVGRQWGSPGGRSLVGSVRDWGSSSTLVALGSSEEKLNRLS